MEETIWIATEFDIEDGGRSWIQAARDPDLAKALCQARHDRERAAEDQEREVLVWTPSPAAAWQFDQLTQTARLHSNRSAYYEVREVTITTAVPA